MPSDTTVARCIAEAEKRALAIEVLCGIINGQVKAELRQLDEIKAALASPARPGRGEPGYATPGDTSLAMLES